MHVAQQTLSDVEQQQLLALARAALEARVRREPPPPVPHGGAFDWPCGAFVTIHHQGELRGCLGRIDVDAPLADTIAHLGAVVADSDPRFHAVRSSELPDIGIEISVLTPEREVASIDEIELGRHGVIVEQGHRRGLLLPQVAIEWGWDRATFLDHACRKASLPADAWRKGAKIFVFEAQVFGAGDRL